MGKPNRGPAGRSRNRQRFAPSPPSTPESDESGSHDKLRPLWLGWLTALLVASTLLPSETAGTLTSGIFLQLLWLLLLLGWLLAAWARPATRFQLGATELALGAFVLAHSLSGWVMISYGQARPALNMIWLWIGFGAAFFLMRQLIRERVEARALVSVMVALSVGLSMFGFYQYFVSMPETRKDYERNPEMALARAGIDAPQGSPQRSQFESRLYSTEPLATFSLTNSLSCFLSPWLLIVLGIAFTQWNKPQFDTRLLIAILLCAVVIAACWLLTKSRTSWIATACGATVLLVYGRRSGWRPDWRIMVGAAAAIPILVVLATAVGGLDLLVLTESSKALLYRVQYWQATLQLIAEHPWWGCGPGNFQAVYTAFKLPEASETISDPHNWLLEIWATSGTVGMVACLGVVVAYLWQLKSLRQTTTEDSQQQGAATDSGGPGSAELGSARPGSLRTVWAIYAGAGLGLFLALPAGVIGGLAPDVALVCGVPFAAASLFLWHRWVQEGDLPLAVVLAAIVLMLVNLSASGGISFGGIAHSLWLLVAISLLVANGSTPGSPLPRPVKLVFMLGGCLLLAGFYYTAYWPILGARQAVSEGRLHGGQYRPERALASFQEAALADPFASEPLLYLASLQHQKAMQTGAQADFEVFGRTAARLIQSDPQSSTLSMQCGDWFLASHQKSQQIPQLKKALEYYRRGVSLYPNYNRGHAQLAWALWWAGRTDQAVSEAEEALRLDELNPHEEQKLRHLRLNIPDPAAANGLPDPQKTNAEQMMRALRSSQ